MKLISNYHQGFFSVIISNVMLASKQSILTFILVSVFSVEFTSSKKERKSFEMIIQKGNNTIENITDDQALDEYYFHPLIFVLRFN